MQFNNLLRDKKGMREKIVYSNLKRKGEEFYKKYRKTQENIFE